MPHVHAADAWYDASWAHRIQITIDHTKVPNTNQTNFPVLISLTGLANINTNGTDIRFTSDDGSTLLAREIESYSSGALVAWVKVPVVSASVDTVIYMYYGNSGATEPGAGTTYGSQKVWDDGGSNNYKAVWHLPNGTTLTANDSTSNLNNGTLSSTPPTATAGKADGAARFNGSSNYISRVSQTTWDWATSDYTVEMWINNISNQPAGAQGPLQIGKMIYNSGTQYWSFGTKSNGNVEWYYWNGAIQRVTGTSVVPLNTWTHLTMTVSGMVIKLFLNGTLEASGTKTGTIPTDSSTPLILGANNSTYYNGLFDEARISNTARSDDWIKTEYNNQSSPSTFYSFINQDPPPPPDVPTVLTATPGNSQVSLSWNAPGFDGGSPITDYLIEYKPHTDSDWTQFGHVASTATTAIIAGAGLLNGLNYDFKVSAVNAWGASIASNIVEATPATVPGAVDKAIATRGNTSASVAFTPFLTPTTGVSWYSNDWTYRKKITIDHTKVPNTNQTNFPVLISLTGLANINTNGTDIRFTSDDGSTLLAREIESYSSGALVAWVKVPVVSASVDTVIYMYYGNSGATEPGAGTTYGSQKVWDDGGSNNYKAVWHLNNPLAPIDSTSNLKNGTNSGSTQTIGKIGYGGDFSGNDYISQPVLLGSSGTVSFWLNPATLAGTSSGVYFGSSDDGSVNQMFTMQNWTNGSTYWGWLNSGVDKRVATSQAFPSGFFLATLSWDTATGLTTLFWNGDQVGQTTGLSSVYSMAWTPYIMAYHNSVNFLFPATGSIDEVRISSVTRSADWAKTEYNNQNSPATFYSPATEENVSSQYSGSPVTNYTVTSSPGGITATGATSPIIVTGLTNGTEYTFIVSATNIAGTGPASIASDPITPLGVPGAPTEVVATPGNGQVSLLWSAPVSDGGSAITDYVIEYKLTSAPDEPASWQIFSDSETPTITSTPVTGLTNGTSYDFRVSAVNDLGQGISSAITSVILLSSWHNVSWAYRTKVTIDHTKVVNSTLNHFPVLISTTATALKYKDFAGGHVSKADGGDILFVSADGTMLNFEIEKYSASTGELVAWVKVPSLSSSTDTDIYMYYGNFAATAPAASVAQGVWDDGGNNYFKGVWHLANGENLNLVDSLSGQTFTNNNTIAVTTAQIGSGATSGTSNTNKDLTIANNLGILGGTITQSIWVKINTAPNSGQYEYIVSHIDNTTHTSYDIGYTNVGGTKKIFVDRVKPTITNNQVTTNVDLGTSNWHKIDLVYNSSTSTLYGYLDGSSFGTPLVTSGNGSGTEATKTSLFSARSINNLFLSGQLDEYRISNTVRSADWIATEYNNQSSPSTFSSMASEELSGFSVPDAPTSLSAISGDSQVDLSWTAPVNAGSTAISDYVVEYKLSGDSSWSIFSDGVSESTTYTVTGLASGISYDFRVSAVNSIGQSASSSVVTSITSSPWYNVSWGYRTKVTIDHTKVVNSTLNYFPVLISTTSTALKHKDFTGGHVGKADGGDIIFTASDGTTVLNYEIEKYSSSTGELVAWVKVPSLATSTDTSVYVYYGNSAATAPAASVAQGVWDDGGNNYFKGVWHLKETGTNPQVFDSTANSNNSTVQTWTPTTSGQIGYASALNGSSQYIDVGSNLLGGITERTFEAWVKGTSFTNAYNSVISQSEAAGGVFTILVKSTGKLALYVQGASGSSSYDGTGATTLSAGTFYHVVLTYKSGVGLRGYINGSLDGSAADRGNIVNGSNLDVQIGNHPTVAGRKWNGLIDEVRVSNVARSADWIKTEYNNQSSPSTFSSLSSEEFSGFSIPDAPTSLSATPGDSQIVLSWAAPINNGNSSITDYVVEYKPSNGSSWFIFPDGVSSSTIFAVTGLTNGTSYDFRISTVSIVGQSVPSDIVAEVPVGPPDVPIIGAVTAGNTQVSVMFSDTVVSTAWYNNNWTYRKKITIDHTKVPNTDQNNFPVLVSLAGLSNINTGGTDIRFTSSDGTTEIAREIESYSSGNLISWVKVPTLSTSVDTVIYMYYGNMFATEPSPSSTYGSQNVWDDGENNYFKGVWHLPNGTTLSGNDSTSYAINGTVGSTTSVASGKIDGGASFTGDFNSYVGLGTYNPLPSGTGTASIWVNWNTSSYGKNNYALAQGNDDPIVYGVSVWGINIVPSSVSQASVHLLYATPSTGVRLVSSGTLTAGVGEWHLVTAVMKPNVQELYFDGTLVKNGAYAAITPSPSAGMFIGKTSRPNPYSYTFNGSLDEARISAISRSADWIKTEYNNQNSPLTFYAVADQETVYISNGGSPITSYIVTSSPGGFTGTGNVSPIIVSGLTNGTAYTFTVVSVNSVGTSASSSSSNVVTPFGVPGAPTEVVATPGNGQVSLLWSAPVSDGGSALTDYSIEYKLTSAPDEPASWQIFSDSETPTITSTPVTGLTNGTSYDFRILAVSLSGVSNPSMTASATPAIPPDAPTSPVATAGNTQASVAFTPPVSNGGSAITSYTVTSSPGGITATGTESPIVVSGLTNGTPYTFTVTATNTVGTGASSSASESSIPATIPDAPTSPVATAGNTQASIAFTPPVSNGGSAITSYTVTSSPGGIIATGTESPILVTGLTNGTSYTFTVTATNQVGTGSASSASDNVIPFTIPDVPTALSPTAGNAQVSLSWSAPATNGGSAITDYIIEYKLSAAPTWSIFSDAISPEMSGVVNGLINGSLYDFRIKAVNLAGQGGASSEVQAMPISVPDSPTIGGVTPGNAQVSIEFTPPVSNNGSEITSYTVTSSPGGFTATGTESPIVVPGLTNGTSYTFTVTATNAVGEGPSSNPSVSTTPITVPDAPVSVSAVEGNTQAIVSFSPPPFNGGTPITSYTVTSSPGGIIATGTESPIVVPGLTNGTSYTFTITATNPVGTGSSSSASTPIRLSTEPDKPTNLAAVVLGSSIALTWSAPVSNGGKTITDYVIEYQLSAGGTWSAFVDGLSSQTSVTVTGLSNRRSYDFRIRALNSIGQSIPSDTISATPGEPAQVLIQSFSDSIAPSIATTVRITNEGAREYEYQYVWCVTNSATNFCGGGDDIFSASNAKLIQSGENWDTTLYSNILTSGNFWFHVQVTYGSEVSSAHQSFIATVTNIPNDPPDSGGGSSGGGGGSLSSLPPKVPNIDHIARQKALSDFLAKTLKENKRTGFATRLETVLLSLSVRGVPILRDYTCQKHHTDTFGNLVPNYTCQIAEKAQAVKIISSLNKEFNPLKPVSRIEAYAIMMKSICVMPATTSSNWQTEVIKEAMRLGFTVRTLDTFEPDRPLSIPESYIVIQRLNDYSIDHKTCVVQ